MGGRIFINYRRTDSSAWAGRLYDRLLNDFTADQLFMDIDDIEPGVDFTRVVDAQVAICDVFIVIIGRDWLTVRDEKDRHRLENIDDLVRIEIEAAIKREIRVIPVLVDGAKMPRPDQLPESLRPLALRQASRVTHEGFGQEVARLVALLKRSAAFSDAKGAELAAGGGGTIWYSYIRRELHRHPRIGKSAGVGFIAVTLFAVLFFNAGNPVKWAYQRITVGKYLDRDYSVAECDRQLTTTCAKYGGVIGQADTLAKMLACPKMTLLPSSEPRLKWTSLWITDTYSYAPGGGGPGGGLLDGDLKVGGWGDWYFSLIKFELPTKNAEVGFAGVLLFVQDDQQETVPLFVDRVIEPWKWDLTQHVWWKDRPGGFPIISEPYPAPRKLHWYVVEITPLYNQWGSGAIGNFGFQMRPSSNYGSIVRFTNNLATDKSKIPHLLICEK